MEVLLTNLLDQTSSPIFYAFILGLMTAISPCPMATNITAIAYIGKNIENQKKVFYNGLIYTLGRAITYTVIGLIFYFGFIGFEFQGFMESWGQKFLGPILIIIGIFMFGVIKLNIPAFGKLNEKMQEKSQSGFWGVLLLGIVFALAFCPYAAILYFGMLIPMTVTSASGLYLPLVYALGTGLPVIIFAWFIAFAVGKIGGIYKSMKIFETWFRRIVALVFIAVGVYYCSYLF